MGRWRSVEGNPATGVEETNEFQALVIIFTWFGALCFYGSLGVPFRILLYALVNSCFFPLLIGESM